ncbi:hypothetical protein PMI16_04920 [Herbaspirillum sp. CF444]|nr:hypothetical protein PMI16_04920 [Herbaspirillum sp. CF444]
MPHLPGINKLTPPHASPILRPRSSHPGIIPAPHHNRGKWQRNLHGINHTKLDRISRRHQQSPRNQPGIRSSTMHRRKTAKAVRHDQRRSDVSLQDILQALRPHRQIRRIPTILLDAFKRRIKTLPARLPMFRPAAMQSRDDQHTKIGETRHTAVLCRALALRLRLRRLAHVRPPWSPRARAPKLAQPAQPASISAYPTDSPEHTPAARELARMPAILRTRPDFQHA